MRKIRKTVAILCAALLVGGGNVAAHADNVEADGDGVVPLATSPLELGDVDCGVTESKSAQIAIKRSGAINNQTYANSAVVNISVTSVSGSGLSAAAQVGTITLPGNWTTIGNNTLSSLLAASVSLNSVAPGDGAGTITYQASGASASGGTTTRTVDMPVSWTTLPCVTNTSPLAPGAPMATSPNQGAFTLNWAPATDEDEDGFTYSLEGKDADDAAFTTIQAGLTSPTYTFGAGHPAEGTWTYRVKAVESATSPALSSAYSANSSGVVVDRTGPNPPTAAADRNPEYAPVGGIPWWKNTATVTFSDSGDLGLPDTSAGSGVASVTAPQTFTVTGSHVASGTATDNAGNVSTATTLPVSVDATAPVVSVDPSVQVIKGTTASVGWTASDTGSGLATPAAGSVTLDTATVGTRTVAVPGAMDNVGLVSAPVSYTYTVVYDFTGFFQPVDMDRMNVAKAGSAIPIKFSLGENQGLAVLDGAPQFVITGTASNGDPIEQTVTAGSSSLSYDATTNQYVYVWKTDKTWAGKAGTLKVKLIDGKTYEAQFSFTK